MCVPKPCSVALMKSTLWSIDLACGLIDAVFKNSLVWGMGELQGSRRSCRAHLSMFTEPGTFIQQQEKRPEGGHPVPNESHCHSVPDTHNTCTQSHKVRKEAHIVHVIMHLHASAIIIDVLGLNHLILFYGLIVGCLCHTSSLVHKSFILTDITCIHFI